MEKPIISIIVPVYNAEKYLSKCLDSIVKQTFREIEIICINDGSTDSSGKILQNYERLDARVHVIDKVNEGVSVARNIGLKVSSGDFVMFVDADDWIEETTCELAIKFVIQEKADVVIWPYISEHNSGSMEKSIFSQDKIVFKNKDVKEKLHRRFIGIIGEELEHPEKADSLSTVWGKLYRRDIIVDNEIEFPDIREIGTYEDGLFNLYLFRYATTVVYFNRYLYHYRRTNNVSVTSGFNPELPRQWKRLFQIMEDYIDGNHLTDVYRKALNNRICLSVLGLGLNILASDFTGTEKRREIKKIISVPRYKQAYKQLDLSYFPMHWKLFYGCAKFGNTLGVYVLLIMIKKIIN